MKSFNEFRNKTEIDLNENLDWISYEIYSAAFDETFYQGYIKESILQSLVEDAIAADGQEVSDDKIKKALGKLSNIFSDLKKYFEPVTGQLGLSLSDVAIGFKTRTFFQALSFFKFSIKELVKGLTEIGRLWHEGLGKAFQEIYKNKLIQQLEKKAISFDQIIQKYPILKRVGGVAVGSLLIWMWLNATLVGHYKDDLDFSGILKAISGSWSLQELFTSPDGIRTISTFLAGKGLGLSGFSWLGFTPANIVLGLLYTSYVLIKGSDNPKAKKIMSILNKKII